MECNFWLLGVHRHIIAAGEETDGLYDIIEGVAKPDSCRKCCSNGTVAIRIFRPLTGRLVDLYSLGYSGSTRKLCHKF